MVGERTQGNRTGQHGFSLIEVLAALAVFSIAVMAYLHLQTENVRTVARLEERAYARIVAGNRLAELLAQAEPLRTGITTGESMLADADWSWETKIARTQERSMLRIIVSVRCEGDEQVIAEASGFREADR